ncbi:MAG: branched-chain amino acid ABC transporter permease [bacterium]|nr:branched-chain amino acid ABC transporter permease [bacterium]
MIAELLTRRGRTAGGAAVLLFFVIGPLLTDRFGAIVLTQCVIWAILAMSLDLMLGYAGMASLGHAAFFGAGAYATAIMAVTYKAGFIETFLVALLVAAVITAIFALVALRAGGVYFLMITFSLAMLVWGLAYRWDSMTGGENGISGLRRPEILQNTVVFYYLTLLIGAGLFILFSVLVRSSFGKTLVGIRESESRMRTLGYNVWLHKYIIYMISGIFSGLSGFLWAYHNSYVAPGDVELITSFSALLMVSIGGVGTLIGPILGATIFVFLENIVNMYTERSLSVVGAVYIIVVLFAPAGIIGLIRQISARRKGSLESVVAKDLKDITKAQ